MKDESLALRVAKEYLDVLCEPDIESAGKKNKNPALTRTIVRVYSRLVCTIEADKTLYDDIRHIYGAVRQGRRTGAIGAGDLDSPFFQDSTMLHWGAGR